MKTINKIISLLLCAVIFLSVSSMGVEAAPITVAATEKITVTTTADTVKLTWKKVSKATGYRVYRSVNGQWKAVKTVKKNTYTVEDLTASESYKFAVKTYRTYGGKTYWSSKLKTVNAKTKAMGNTAKPSATSTKDTVTLKWTEVPGATGYRVFQLKGNNWVKLSTLTGKTFKVTSLKENNTYKFRIRPYAKTSKGVVWGKLSAITAIKTVDNTKAKFTTPVIGTKGVTLNWSKVSGATGYRLNMLVDGKWEKVAGAIKGTSYNVDRLESDTEYTFFVRAYKIVNGKVNWFTKSNTLTIRTKKASSGTEPTTKPNTEPTTKPNTEPTTKPNTEPTTKPNTEPTTKPGTEPTTQHKNHTVVIDPAVAATCTKTGLTEGKHCSVCNAVIVAQKIVPKTAHSYTSSVTTQATCKVEGVRTYKCSCGDKYTEKIEKKAHTIVIDPAGAATCIKTGLTEGKHCSVCSTVTVAQQTVAKKAHSIVIDSAVAATCTSTGLTEGKHCSVCKTVTVAQQTVAKKDHTVVIDPAVEATCSKAGLTEGKHCSVCETVIVARQSVAKKAHKIVIDSAVAATCTKTGLTEGKHCSVCNTVTVSQMVTPVKAHYDGNNDYKCDMCGTSTGQPEELKAYRIAKYKSILESNTIYFKISTEYSNGELIPVEFARKNGNMYMKTTVEGMTMSMYYEKNGNKMHAYMHTIGDILPLYYSVPESEMDDMDMAEMLELMQVGTIGEVSVIRTTFKGQSVIRESFYDSKTGYTNYYYFNSNDVLIGIKKEHPKKADDIIYITELKNTVSDSMLKRPDVYIDISGLM